MKVLPASLLAAALLAVGAPVAGASVLPTLPGAERQTPNPGCPFGIPLLPGTVCPPSEQIDPEEAESYSAAHPPPPGNPVTGTPAPYSSHSMLYACCTPAAQKERGFAAARASGAGYMRLDVNLRGIFRVRSGRPRRPDWEGVDRIAALGRRYRLRVVAVLTHVPDHITQCNANHQTTCPAGDSEAYGRYAALIAERLKGVATHFEIVNEPDGRWAFRGTPQEYARMLEAAHRHIRTRVPKARVLLGGLMHHDKRWISAMLATPGIDAIRKFDIANVHVRGPVTRLAPVIRRWRAFLSSRGFKGPLWVTEHGYPGATRYQYDRAFRGGERAQAAFLAQSLRRLKTAGARQVFVTLRDSWSSEFLGEYASEGVINLGERSPFPVRQKASFDVVRKLNARWRRRVERLGTLRRRHLRAAARHRRAGRRAQARRHQRLARHYARRLRAISS
jgi:hypothetical protein